MKRILQTLFLICSLQNINGQTEDYYGPVTISFHGFICNRPTNDDALGGDGVGDEVSAMFWDWTDGATDRANYSGLMKIYGENFLLPYRVKAGTSTINGGLKAGDSYYREGVYGDNDPLILSNYAIVNTFCSQNTIIAILPAIFERDNGPLGVTPIQDFGVVTRRAFNDDDIHQQILDFRDSYVYNDNNPYGFILPGRYIGLDAKFAGMFSPNKNKLATRPIGLFSNWDYSSQLIVLTPKTIKIISEKDYGYGKGILPVFFNEETMENSEGHGNYIILLRFVSDIKDRNANNPASNLRSVSVKVNNAGPGEEYKFRLRTNVSLDSVIIKNPNTTATFPTKIPPGHHYHVTQISGPRTCQFINYIGTISKDTVVIANCGSPSAQYKVGIAYGSSLYSNKEKFEFRLNGGEKIELNSNNPIVYFSQKLSTGQTYTITQVSGIRNCNMPGANTGSITNNDVLVSADCGNPPLSIFKLNVIGIGAGETFSFADNYQRTHQYPFSTLANLGGFPRGDYYLIKQTGGPRQCKLSSNEGNVSETNITILADCRKPATPLVPPKNKYDLVTRSSDDKIINTYYESWAPVIAGTDEDEGRYVAFGMYGKGIDGSTGKNRQIFWRDRKTGITKLVSKTSTGEEGNGGSAAPAISDDGQYVVFETNATNLAPGDKNGYYRDVFLWDQQTGQLTLVSKSVAGQTANGESYEPVISGNGNTVAFTSHASDIVALEPVFSTPNIYVYDVRNGITEFITKDYETGKAGSGYAPTISEDGSKIAFCAYTNKLVKNDNNNLWDIFLWQRDVPELKRISMTDGGGERNQGEESSSRVVWPSISGDGNNIVFATTSSNIVSGDNNKLQDIFLYNIPAGSIKRVSTANGPPEGDGDSPAGQGERIGISYDGTWITYNTNASNLGVPKGNLVKQNTETGEILPVTIITNVSTARPMISREGNFVIAGYSEKYDKRFSSSGIFVIYTGK
ncbi:MAG: hypothetical protein WBC06_01895 [Chitinophagaceae bacterium]